MKKPTEQRPCFNVKTLAAFLHCSPRHVERLNSSGRLPRPIRIGRLVRWPHDEITAWIHAGCPDRRRWRALRLAQ